MDKGFINKLMLIRDNEFDDQVQYTLLRTIEKYPYFSLLYMYRAKSFKAQPLLYEKHLSLASVYSPDRTRLKEMMETNIAFQFEEKQEVIPTNLDIINAKIEQLKKLYAKDDVNENKDNKDNNDIIKEIDSYSEPNISNTPTKEELVERFLHIENPKLKNLEDQNEAVSLNEVVKKSANQEFEIVTETMAKVYLQQGYKDRAIKIYEQLILANPEKSIYFANQIKKIEDNF